MFDNNINKSDFSKSEIEQGEKEKQEYKLLGKFSRTPGLKLFAYNSQKDEIFEVKISQKSIIDFTDIEKTLPEEATVDSRNIHFEALNITTAQKRVSKFKAGKIKELDNLKKPSTGCISFF